MVGVYGCIVRSRPRSRSFYTLTLGFGRTGTPRYRIKSSIVMGLAG
jgi:hypothetical protein